MGQLIQAAAAAAEEVRCLILSAVLILSFIHSNLGELFFVTFLEHSVPTYPLRCQGETVDTAALTSRSRALLFLATRRTVRVEGCHQTTD